ncbi:hypothetical protein [Halomarina rubra]|uniref:Lipoprotein n=1 Tax=Halomarina rubra TaxID=2071873 RepID=A0ABD6AS30_9EURY|nr:hypothetical protein [Halomarina rubra]
MSPPSRPSDSCLVLAVVALLLTSGCLGWSSAAPRDDCPDERVTAVPYPDRPATLTNETVRAFVADLEEAYTYGRHADGDHVEVAFDPEPDRVDRTGEGWFVTVETAQSTRVCSNGTVGVSDGGERTIRYFVNDSAVFRDLARSPGEDPREYGVRIRVGATENAS